MHVQGVGGERKFLRQTFRQSTLRSQQAQRVSAAQRMTNPLTGLRPAVVLP
jgi:hypothetical protein